MLHTSTSQDKVTDCIWKGLATDLDDIPPSLLIQCVDVFLCKFLLVHAVFPKVSIIIYRRRHIMISIMGQWSLRRKDILGSATLSSVERLSISRRLKMYYCYGPKSGHIKVHCTMCHSLDQGTTQTSNVSVMSWKWCCPYGQWRLQLQCRVYRQKDGCL